MEKTTKVIHKDYVCADCDAESDNREELTQHCRENDHGFFSNKIYVKIPDGEYEIGKIGVDSGTVLIGDPCYLEDSPHHPAKVIHQDWSKFCDIMGKNNHNPFMLGDMVVTPTFYGDGEYPVVAKFTDGKPERITIEFDPSDEWYWEPVDDAKVYKKLDVEASRKARNIVLVDC